MAAADLQADILGDDLNDEVEAQAKAQSLFGAAARHDPENIRMLLKSTLATVRDPVHGGNSLHAAVGSFKTIDSGPSPGSIDDTIIAPNTDEEVKKAEATMKLLLQNGAIWNDLNEDNETPGCMAFRLGLHSLYEIMVDAGVRAELLFNRLDDFAPLADEDEDDDDEDAEAIRLADEAAAMESEEAFKSNGAYEVDAVPTLGDEIQLDTSTENANYLSSALSFAPNRILDSSNNGVMMSWESTLMQRTARKLLPDPGKKVLNIGFGMGIFDTFVQDEHAPAEHHIVEAHPDVLARMKETGWGAETKSHDKKNVTIHAGTWQEVLPQLVAQNLTFDAIFFDTFAEGYKDFREFFSEYVIGLLNEKGRWSFFHGLGADRQVCYDVYTKVVEMDLFDAGFEVEWEDVELPELSLEAEERHLTWEGVKRSYFSVENYRLPMCKFIG